LAELDAFNEGFMSIGYGDEAALIGNGEAAMELMGQWAPATQVSSSDQGGIGETWASSPSPLLRVAWVNRKTSWVVATASWSAGMRRMKPWQPTRS
jgi:ABC-type glycerol-3-phosphate transport system substrate-binding protein